MIPPVVGSLIESWTIRPARRCSPAGIPAGARAAERPNTTIRISSFLPSGRKKLSVIGPKEERDLGRTQEAREAHHRHTAHVGVGSPGACSRSPPITDSHAMPPCSQLPGRLTTESRPTHSLNPPLLQANMRVTKACPQLAPKMAPSRTSRGS